MINPEPTPITRARALVAWYETSLRSFLAEHAPEHVGQLDDEQKRLTGLVQEDLEVVVCLIGASGIGKSTLLNAVAAGDKLLVPAGGIGPLTALATEVRFKPQRRLRVHYHKKGHLWRVAFALNSHVSSQRRASERELGASVSEQANTAAPSPTGESGDADTSPTLMDQYVRIGRLIVTGNQVGQRSLDYLADALSIACSNKPQWGSALSEEDAKRVVAVREALATADSDKERVFEEKAGHGAFHEALRDHTAGFLSPIIRRIEVGWPSPLLRDGLVLVDLPGVGVASDVYKTATQEFVRERARAVVLVVNRSGLTDSVMELLRTTGYWDRLVLSSDDPSADPCALLLAVTHVDDLAEEEWRAIEPDGDGKRPKKSAVFSDVRARLISNLTNEFEQHLSAFTATETSATIKQARSEAAKAVMKSLQVHPVSAIEYRRLIAGDEDDRPFLQELDQSGVPVLALALQELARSHRDRKMTAMALVTRRFAESLWSRLATVESLWSGSGRAAEEAKRVREALQGVLNEKGREYDHRRASFRTFLGATVQEKIKSAVLEAKDEARKDVTRYLRGLQDAHWATLRAAVTRGGSFYGARFINLPDDIALRFQEPVASVWSQSLLKAIREETYRLARHMRALVEEICDWASTEHAAHVDDKVVKAQRTLVSNQSERLRDVGKEAIEELREVVKTKILKTIQRPIQERCEHFVERGDHVGAGVKSRILGLFAELAEEATEAASKPTSKTLLTRYESVRSEIQTAFEEWGNPLESAANAIVERHEDRMKRSDSQKRQKVLLMIQELRSEATWIAEILDLGGDAAEIQSGHG